MSEITATTNARPVDKATVKTIPNKDIVLDLSNPTKIIFTISSSGETGIRMLHEGVFTLTKGLIYKLPITNKTLSSKDNFGIKLELEASDNVRILNVDSGVATIEAIIHGSTLKNGQLLGNLF
jgi:hypothetical protein